MNGFAQKLSWIVFGALTCFHAKKSRIKLAARSVNPVPGYCCEK